MEAEMPRPCGRAGPATEERAEHRRAERVVYSVEERVGSGDGDRVRCVGHVESVGENGMSPVAAFDSCDLDFVASASGVVVHDPTTRPDSADCEPLWGSIVE